MYRIDQVSALKTLDSSEKYQPLISLRIFLKANIKEDVIWTTVGSHKKGRENVNLHKYNSYCLLVRKCIFIQKC